MSMYATNEDLELASNTSTRVPVCVCIDTSGSMSKKDDSGLSRIDRVKEGVDALFNEIRNDEMALYSAEICIIGFNTTPYVLRDFALLKDTDRATDYPLVSGGKGDIGLGVKKGLELLEKRKQKYKDSGVEYYQPWLIIMTDGHSTGEGNYREVLAEAQKNVLEFENNKKMNVVPVYIGYNLQEDAKAQADLGGFSKKNDIQDIGSTRFSDFFIWLGKSVSIIANEGEDQESEHIDFSDLFDWTQI